MNRYTIRDPKALDALPDKSYVQENDGFPVYKHRGMWYLAIPNHLEGRPSRELEFPVRVLYRWGE